jgi:hypothetical protein
LIVTTLSIVFYSSYFKISPNRLIIERIDDYSDINIAYRAIEPLYGRSLWSTSTAEVQELITHLQKNITHVTLERIYPNSIRILLESSPLVYSVIFPGTNKNYELSKNGILIPNKGAVSRLPRLQIYSPELFESSFLDYKQAVDINTMNAINSILAILKSDFKVSEVGSLLLYSVENELHVLMQNKNRLIFVLDSTLDKQLL